MTQLERLLEEIVSWAAATGIPDLTTDEIEDTIWKRGKKIWAEAHAKKKQQVDEVLATFNSRGGYKGKPIEYRGSAMSGERSVKKGKTHFDETDFDVDMYVVHAVEFESIVRLSPSREKAGKIFPLLRDTEDLLVLSHAVAAQLKRVIPGVPRIETSEIVLRKEPP